MSRQPLRKEFLQILVMSFCCQSVAIDLQEDPAKIPPLPESITTLVASTQPRIRCSMISPADVAFICESYTRFYAAELHGNPVTPTITCSESSPIAKTIISSTSTMKLLGSCNWINMYVQWSSYWSSYGSSGNHGISSENFESMKTSILNFENGVWTPEIEVRRVQVSGANFNLAAITVPPLVIFKKGTFEIEGGTFKEFFGTVANYYNFTYQIDVRRFKEQGQGRKSKDGSWSGVIGGLVRKEFDVTFMGHQVSRYPYLYHSMPLYFDEAGFVVGQPAVHISFYALVAPFTPLVWFFNLISLLAEIFACYLILSVKIKMGEEHKETKGDLAWDSWDIPYSICVEQGPNIPESLIKLVLLWSVAWMIINEGYKDKLLATLTFPQLDFVPKNLQHLKEHPEYRILLEGFLISFRLNHSNNPDIMPLKPRLELQDPKAVNSTKCVLAATVDPKTVCMGFKPFLQMAISTNATISDDFETSVVSDNILPHVHISLGLSKYSPVAEDFELMGSAYRESALYELSKQAVMTTYKKIGKEWLNKGNPELRAKLQKKMDAQKQGVIKLTNTHFFVVYIIYIASIPIALLIFWVELRSRSRKKLEQDCGKQCEENLEVRGNTASPDKQSSAVVIAEEVKDQECPIFLPDETQETQEINPTQIDTS